MLLRLGLLPERLAARPAHERLLPGVYQHVLLALGLGGEAALTHRTDVRLLASVRQVMPIQVRFVNEASTALVTSVGPLA